jgi:hypothetical protein
VHNSKEWLRPTMEIRQLIPADAEALWKLRFEALERKLASFGESLEEFQKVTVSPYAERLASRASDNSVFGVFDDAVLVGMSGFRHLQNLKERHKGWIGEFISRRNFEDGDWAVRFSHLWETARALPELHMIQLKVATSQKSARDLYAWMSVDGSRAASASYRQPAHR